MFRDALDADLPNIATMADANALLIPPLDQAAFVRMLRWLHEDVVIASGVRSTADTAVVLTIAPRLQMVYEEEQKILAHFGAIPFAMKFGDQRLLSCFAANIVIDESARKKNAIFPITKAFCWFAWVARLRLFVWVNDSPACVETTPGGWLEKNW